MDKVRSISFSNELKQSARGMSSFKYSVHLLDYTLEEKAFKHEIKEHINRLMQAKYVTKEDTHKISERQGGIIFELIVKIPFEKLKELSLKKSQIKSIEAISSLNAPVLNKLQLTDNHIVSFKPLVKCKFLLEKLEIQSQDAQFDQLFHLNRTKFPTRTQNMSPIKPKDPVKINMSLMFPFAKIQASRLIKPDRMSSIQIKNYPLVFIKIMQMFALIQDKSEK